MTKKSKLQLIIISSAVFIVISTGLTITRMLLSKKTNKNIVYHVKKETYENCIEIAGTVSAAEEQTLQALGAGTVINVFVKKGDRLKKGDIIIQLDSTEQEYNIAKLDYDMAASKISGSKKELELQEKQRLSLLRKLEDRKVTATFDGIIADLDVSEGDSLEAKDSVGTLVNIDYLTADVEVSETDVPKLKIGQRVDFTFPAYKGTVQGYVVGWPAIGEVTSRGATVVKAKVRIDDYPEQILPNFSFTGKIQITEPTDNIIVERYAIAYEDKKPYVIMVVGVNGVGKTTTIGKLAHMYKAAGKKVYLGAADTFRAAAVEQLCIWGERVGVPVIKQQMGSDPASVAYDTLSSAKANDADVVLIDTAGRLHNKIGLMNELTKIKNVMQKVVPDAPHDVMLVLDGSTGQNAFEQAKQFIKATEVSSLAITKLDGTAKGGVVIGISNQLKVPVKFIGLGEKVTDLQPFNRIEFVDSLFDGAKL